MTQERATHLLEIYGRAWMTKSPDLLDEIFTEDATYHDPREPKNIGRDAIKNYWKYKVLEGQENIVFKLQNVWIAEDTVFAEWFATFNDIKRQLFIDMKEVAIFTVKDDKFDSLREYYFDIKTPLSENKVN